MPVTTGEGTNCTQCSAGYGADATGEVGSQVLRSCNICVKGQSSLGGMGGTGLNVCEPCARNKFAAVAGASTCANCGTNRVTLNEGSDDEATDCVCDVGFEQLGTVANSACTGVHVGPLLQTSVLDPMLLPL